MNRNNRKWKTTSLALATTIFAGAAWAASPGDLDTSFNPTSPIPGTVSVEFPESMGCVAFGVAVQNDERIVAAGRVNFYASNSDFGLARFLTNGVLDESFGDNGFATTDLGAQDDAATVAIQSDGKILVAGETWLSGVCDLAVARYNSDGTLDNAFANNGVLVFQWLQGSTAKAIATQPDGKILLAGSAFEWGVRSHMGLVRLATDGTVDPGFGDNGKATADFGVSDFGTSLTLQPDGKIVLAGLAWDSDAEGWAFAAARFNPNGTLDTGFGVNGKTTHKFDETSHDAKISAALQPDGKIVLAGHATANGNTDFALVRFTADGRLDTSFGDNGAALTDFSGEDDSCFALTVLDNGTIVAVGETAKTGFDRFFSTAYYTSGGQLDTSFGDNGLVMTFLWRGAKALAVAGGNRLVVAGAGGYSVGRIGYCVACYTLSGYRDGGSAPNARLLARENKTSRENATSISLDLSISYPETPPNSIIEQVSTPAFGIVTNIDLNDSILTYYPQRNHCGYDAFTYTDFAGRVGIVAVYTQPVCLNDFNGNGRTDLIAYSGAAGTWQPPPQSGAASYMPAQSEIVSGDYNGDGKADYAFYNQTLGQWAVFGTDGNILAVTLVWGGAGLQAVAGDYDGDGLWDMALYDQAQSLWYIASLTGIQYSVSSIQNPDSLNTEHCTLNTDAFRVLAWAVPWGGPGMVPVSGDYDGDGRADLAVYHEASGLWHIAALSSKNTDNRSPTTDHRSLNTAPRVLAWDLPWGGPGMAPVSGDYDGDGRNDLCLYEEASGLWYIMDVDGNLIAWAGQWGGPGMAPAGGDFNGDGRDDPAVYTRDTGRWFTRTLEGEILSWDKPWASAN